MNHVEALRQARKVVAICDFSEERMVVDPFAPYMSVAFIELDTESDDELTARTASALNEVSKEVREGGGDTLQGWSFDGPFDSGDWRGWIVYITCQHGRSKGSE